MQIKQIKRLIETNRLSPTHLANLNNKQAIQLLEYLRWKTNDDKPFCPECGNCKKIYKIKARNQYKCRETACGKFFSVTNKTIYHNHSSRQENNGLALAVYAVSLIALGLTIQRISDITGLSYQTVFLYKHKILTSFEDYNDDGVLFSNISEMDGAYFYRYNTKHKKEGRVAISLRERGESGSVRSRFFIGKKETSDLIEKIANKYIKKDTIIHTDGHIAYKGLSRHYVHKFVNHKEEYVSAEGVNNNQCESLNSEARFAIDKERRGVKKTYLLDYLNFVAYNADMRTQYKKLYGRKEMISVKIVDFLTRSILFEVPNDLVNYTQGNHRIGERSGI